jgi:TPR repeat protein
MNGIVCALISAALLLPSPFPLRAQQSTLHRQWMDVCMSNQDDDKRLEACGRLVQAGDTNPVDRIAAHHERSLIFDRRSDWRAASQETTAELDIQWPGKSGMEPLGPERCTNLARGAYGRQLAIFNRYINENPRGSIVLLLRAKLLAQLRQTAAARSDCALIGGEQAGTCNVYALASDNDARALISAVDSANYGTAWPGPEAMLLRGMAKLQMMDLAGARADFADRSDVPPLRLCSFLLIAPPSVNGDGLHAVEALRTMARYGRAMVAIKSQAFTEAINELDQLIRDVPAFAEARLARAFARAHLADFSAARADLAAVAEMKPHYAPPALSVIDRGRVEALVVEPTTYAGFLQRAKLLGSVGKRLEEEFYRQQAHALEATAAPPQAEFDACPLLTSTEPLGHSAACHNVLRWYRREVAMGSPVAISRVGFMLDYGLGTAKDVEEANAWYRKAADLGDTDGMRLLAENLKEGRGVTKDEITALNWFRSASLKGNATAMYKLGFMLAMGQGGPRNVEEANVWYRRAADADEPIGMRRLALNLLSGEGITKNEAEAVAWFRRAANKGDAVSMSELGLMIQNGEGTSKSFEDANVWFRKAADSGDAHGMRRLGINLQYGRGIKKDEKAAIEWYHKAIATGSTEGMINLADVYFYGHGVPIDANLGLQWLMAAANKGSAAAMMAIAKRAAAGEGVKFDLNAALYWFEKAAVAGSDEAQPAIEVLTRDPDNPSSCRAVLTRFKDFETLYRSLPPSIYRSNPTFKRACEMLRTISEQDARRCYLFHPDWAAGYVGDAKKKCS